MKNLSLNKGRPSCLCIFIFAILLSNQVFASRLTVGSYAQQTQQQVTGIVSDTSGPLPNVTVNVKGTNVLPQLMTMVSFQLLQARAMY